MATFKGKSLSIQSLSKTVRRFLSYLAQPILRIFSPSHDDYPKVGVQPFEGDPADPDLNQEGSW
ncbi:hypothetical protein [Acaryochloris sp. IP29b_bin.137]|uniref:hypothetical protein n=1 Tax=Acaryochloris sp. IP29b_bin.137 TaxID=2969217 RepID=UPI002631A390|nr:hypothetical protein [Acaryochloris sp. IP29b_bin.137]